MSSTDPAVATATSRTSARFSRDGLIVAAALAASALLAWAWLLRAPMAALPMAHAMVPDPFSVDYLLPAFAMWAIMMVAMMVPSATPMILLHARIDKASSSATRTAHSLLFGLGYLVIWSGFSAAAALAQAILVTGGVLSAATLAIGGRTLAAALLVAAAIYELTAAKRVCLEKCQSPLLFMLKQYRPGAAGAARAGLLHGLYCLGCCWALMLLLFVGGAMNLAWVALLGIVVIGEKFVPPHWHAERIVAVMLLGGAATMLVL